MNWRRILSIIRKEWWHITRDKTSFGLLLLSPALALVTMAYAFSVDITDVGVVARELGVVVAGDVDAAAAAGVVLVEAALVWIGRSGPTP